MIGIFVAGAMGVLGEASMLIRERRERAHGYTLFNSRPEFPHVDHKSGFVIREPGESLLPRTEVRRRYSIARGASERP